MTIAPAPSIAPSVVDLPAPWCDVPVAVVVPTYNEIDNLPLVVERLFALRLPRLRLIVVDDNSPDGTGRLADELAERMNAERPERMVVVHRDTKDGIGRAYLAGMAAALARDDEFIVQMDADLSHIPEYIPQMLGAAMSTDAGLVIGSRYVSSGTLSSNWVLHRRMLSRGASAYVNSILRMRIADTTAGFKLWRADTLKSIELGEVRSSGFSFQIEMSYRAKKAGVRILEVPIHFDQRHSGKSKISFKIQVEGLWVPIALKFSKRH